MPRPRRSYGRPGTAVFPSDWAASHAPVAGDNLPDTCTVTRPNRATPAAFDQATGRYPAADLPTVYVGPCRVEASATPTGARDSGDEAITVVSHDLVLPMGAGLDIRADDTARVVGRPELRVRSIDESSNSWERRFGCTENQR